MSKMMFIDNEWVDSSNGEHLSVLDPSTGEKIDEVPRATRTDIGRAVDAARDAFDKGGWGKLPPGDRANLLLKLADRVEQRVAEIAELESRNSGKSLKQTSGYDIPYSIDNIRFLAGASRVMEGKAVGEYVPEGTSMVRREPIGVVAVITPWNYPFMMDVWRGLAAIVMGNTVVLKPASYTPLTTLELAKMVQDVGVPKGVFNVVTGPGADAGEELATNSGVDMIAFTGSTEVGKRLSELGSGTLKKVSVELGGKAPFIVFGDADVEAAAQGAVVGGLVNNGEDCANSTRYYVQRGTTEKFLKALEMELGKVRVGDPMDPKTDMGPLVSDSHRKKVEAYIDRGVSEGGELLRGGKRPQVAGHEGGFFLTPAVIRTQNEDSAIVKEEIFGPVFTVLEFDTYDDVIERSNDVIYGLGSSVWTKDVTKAMRAVRDLRFGTVWVNEHVAVPSEMPWAGYKQSGHGASLSAYSLEEYTYVKHVYVDISGSVRKSWYHQIYGDKQ